MSVDLLDLNARVSLSDFELVIDESLELGGVTAIFGPSGSGKSTLLRTIAGFEQPQTGSISCAGEVWFDSTDGVNVPPHQRSVGYMFQDARLFSHLDVDGNLNFALKRRGSTDNLTYEHVVDVLDLG
ncbi:MAG: ATP-binding cassette domain-containing protein, partial [Pseudomonadales bacterium]